MVRSKSSQAAEAQRDAAVTIVELDAAHATGAHGKRAPSALAGWLVAPALFAATATGILFVVRGPDRYFGLAFGALVALAVAWILVSVLFPARVERTCPACGGESLRRLDPTLTRGVVCDACGHTDPHQSSFLMAEAEGALEEIVIAERARSRVFSATKAQTPERTVARSSPREGPKT
jgi:hypothetical protein